MSNYKHGIRTRRLATQPAVPITSDGCIQCVVGTAPVNLAENPYDTVNKPFMFHSKPAAVAGLGYSADFKNYTLCQSMYASFDVFAVAPVIMINVLDPSKHVKAELSKTYKVENGKIRIEETGILLDKLQIGSAGESDNVYEPEKDYIASFGTDGTVTVAVVAGGAAAAEESLKATYVQLDPEAVTYEDVIGSYDTKTKKRTGMELIGRVHQRFGVVPSLLLAPGWSHITAVNLALNAKAQLISSLFTAKMQLNGLQGSGDIAGGEIVFDHDENPINEILNGHIMFHTRIGGYTPAENIENVFEFDPTITEDALKGGAE